MHILCDDLIVYIANMLSRDTLYNYITSCKRIYNLLYDNDDYWTKRFNQNRPMNRQSYFTYNRVHIWDWGRRIKFPLAAIGCATGKEHCCIITEDNDLYVLGNNSYGQLGLTDLLSVWDNPVLIPDLKVKQVACGDNHTVVIAMDNQVLVCGNGREGQLGLLNVTQIGKFTAIPNIFAKHIACGGSHTALIDINDNVLTFGYNWYGQLGNTNRISKTVPSIATGISAKYLDCGDNFTAIIDKNNCILLLQCESIYVNNIHARYLSCGKNHMAIIDDTDSVYVMGKDNFGQLGLGGHSDIMTPTKLANCVRSAFCGENTTAIMDYHDNLKIYGSCPEWLLNPPRCSIYGACFGLRFDIIIGHS